MRIQFKGTVETKFKHPNSNLKAMVLLKVDITSVADLMLLPGMRDQDIPPAAIRRLFMNLAEDGELTIIDSGG